MTPTATDSIRFPEYREKPFIERSEAEAVRDFVARPSTGYPDTVRAMDIKGEPGVGKTWLLRHLAGVELKSDGATEAQGNFLGDPKHGGSAGLYSLYLNLEDWTGTPDTVTRFLIFAVDKKIADWAEQQPTIRPVEVRDAPLGDLSRWLEADVRTLLRSEGKTLVLLLDHAHEAPWSLLELLDQHVLGPLAALPSVFVVTAGRGKPYPWRAPDLRQPWSKELEPFDLDQTQRQLQRQFDRIFSGYETSEIYRLSGGYPRSIFALGSLGLDRNREAFDDELWYLLKGVADPEHKRWLRKCLEALCVLDGFRDDQIWPMLAGRLQKPTYAQRTLAEARALLEELRKHSLVYWDNESSPGVWRIFGRLHALLKGWMSGDPDLWIQMHRTALELFTDWAKRYTKKNALWQKKADYHGEIIQSVESEIVDWPARDAVDETRYLDVALGG